MNKYLNQANEIIASESFIMQFEGDWNTFIPFIPVINAINLASKIDVYELDVQKLRNTSSDAEFRRELSAQISKMNICDNELHNAQISADGHCHRCRSSEVINIPS
jgi:hypothetical protein